MIVRDFFCRSFGFLVLGGSPEFEFLCFFAVDGLESCSPEISCVELCLRSLFLTTGGLRELITRLRFGLPSFTGVTSSSLAAIPKFGVGIC